MNTMTLEELNEKFSYKFLELMAVAGSTVQLSGQDDEFIVFVQYKTTNIFNRNFSVNRAPRFYMRDEDEYAHLYKISDIPRIYRVYIANWKTQSKSVLVYEHDDDF